MKPFNLANNQKSFKKAKSGNKIEILHTYVDICV